MKKIVLLIVCALLACNVYAQGQKFSWGVKAGLNVSNLWGSDVEGTKAKVGYQIGLVGEYRFTSLFALAPELVFSSEGWKGEFIEEDIDRKLTATEYANYINLPIMAKFYVTKKLSIDFGPQIGLNVYMHESYDGNSSEIPSEYYNSFRFGLGLGATYNFKDVFLQARYNLGLTNILKEASNKDYNFQIAVGYKF